MKTGIRPRAMQLSLLCAQLLALAAWSTGSAMAQEQVQLPLPAGPAGAECGPVTAQGTDAVTLKRTFFDDFDSIDFKSNKWTPHYDGGFDPIARRWQGYDWVVKRTAPGIREQQIYVDPSYRGTAGKSLKLNPFKIDNGIMSITAERVPEELENFLGGFQYMSGLLTTRRSFTQMYGYFEIRARVPAGPHLVPAFWLLADDRTWPQELDVMEAPSHVRDTIMSTLHWEEPVGQKNKTACRTPLKSYDQDFHQYGALWTPERIIYYIDRKPVGQVATPAKFSKPMYMLVNLAVGGTWVGDATPDTPMPVKFDVDNISAFTMGESDACTTASNGVKTCQGK